MSKFSMCMPLLLVLIVFASSARAGDAVPEFGDSMQFDPGQPPLRLADLRGKNVLVIFFQSWCPKCNAWSGDMFRQVTGRFADDRSITLVAIYTSGNISEAKTYLAQRKVELKHWVVAADPGAMYYKQVAPDAPLYGAMVVGPDGKVAATRNAGMHFAGDGKKVFLLGSARFANGLPDAKPMVEIDGEIPASLEQAVALAERGQLGVAAKLAGRVRSADAKPIAEQMITDLEARAAKWVEAIEAELTDTDPGNAERYPAYLAAERYMTTLSGTQAGTKARQLYFEARRDKAIRDEARAHQMYEIVLRKAAAQPHDRRAAFIASGMKQIASRYPDTIYGRKAQSHL